MSLGTFRRLQTRSLYTVAATLTTVAVYDTTGHSVVNVEIQNPSGVDTINAQVECATDSAGPWDVMEWDGLQAILPGETRNESFSKMGKTWIRVRAVSTGSAIPSVPVSFHMESA